MADLNNVNIMGRFTADPELRQTPNGTLVCSFTIACNRKKASDGTENTDYVTVTAYEKTAEFISRNFCKGKPVLINGALRTKTYEDKRYSDVRHYSTFVQAREVYFAGKTKAEEEHSTEAGVKFSPTEIPSDMLNEFEEIGTDEEMPF